ncbi:MAG: alpha/beta hydrolase family protein [Acidobacteriia bacterium]|nr:alpha/beta hydrolase family protein [Terriglobia bacterium]
MHDWETRLTTRDTNRVVRPFDWGVEWTRGWPGVNGNLPTHDSEEEFFHRLNRHIVVHSDEFFAYRTPTDFRIEQHPVKLHAAGGNHGDDEDRGVGDFLRFTSAVSTPYPENNIANAHWFPTRGRRAMIVLPQWNADAIGHNALCRMMNFCGIAALRLSMPYHDVRRPAELERADYAVSANVGRTIAAARQAILDVRSCLDWLQSQGYRQFGILGTSLGSCYAFIASAHDERLRVNAFNHASTYFADVVWTGQSTRHIRAGVEREITLESLRQSWLAISPMSYFHQFSRFPKKSLIVYATYDLTFLPEFSRQVVAEFRRRRLDHRVAVLPCGHYTTGETPYKFLDAWHLVRFISNAL